jgi:dolichol-phosphate mannosyltransferase
MQHVSLIIPTYNEARNIPVLIPEIFSYIDKNDINLEIIIIDDGSPDGTAQVARDLAKNYPIRVIERSEKLGLGSAVRVGFAASDRLMRCFGKR